MSATDDEPQANDEPRACPIDQDLVWNWLGKSVDNMADRFDNYGGIEHAEDLYNDLIQLAECVRMAWALSDPDIALNQSHK